MTDWNRVQEKFVAFVRASGEWQRVAGHRRLGDRMPDAIDSIRPGVVSYLVRIWSLCQICDGNEVFLSRCGFGELQEAAFGDGLSTMGKAGLGMKIEKRIENAKLTVSPIGRIDHISVSRGQAPRKLLA